MKTLKTTSLSNTYHQYCLLLTLFIISIHFNLIFIILFYLIYKYRNIINIKLLILMMLIFSLSNYHYNNPNNTNSNQYIIEKEKEGAYLLIKGRERYLIITDDVLNPGDVITLDSKPLSYRKQTTPYGFNAYNYYLGQNIKGYFKDVKTVNIKGHLNVINWRSKLINNTNHLSWFFNRDYINNNNFNYLFLLVVSTYSLKLIYSVIRKVLFYLNISNNIGNLIILITHLLITFIFSHIILVFYLLKLIMDLINNIFYIQLTKLDVISIQIIITLILMPNIIYNQSFVIYSLLLFTSQIIDNKGWLTTILIIPFQLMWFQLINVFNMLTFRFMKQFRQLGVIILFLALFISSEVISNLLVVINNTFNFLPIDLYNIKLKNITFEITILIYLSIIIYYLYPKIKTLILVLMFNLILILIPNYSNNTLYFLDVGQGNGAVYIYNNIVVGIDCYNLVDQFLINHNLELNYLIITHNDYDHARERDLLINKYNPKVIINENSNIIHQGLINTNNFVKINEGNTNILSNLNIEFLYSGAYQTENDNSLVFQLTFSNMNKILFTGDISTKVEDDLIIKYHNKLNSNILVVAHHGSNSSSSLEFIKTVSPSKALISVGLDNRYHFPSSLVLKRLEGEEIIVYRTDLLGTIIIKVESNELITKTPYLPY